MTYTGFDLVHGIASFGALAWMLWLVARSPGDVRRWAVAGLLAGWSIAYPFGIAASRGVVFLGVDAMNSRYIQHALLLVAAYSLVCFFQFSALEPALARGRAIRDAIVLGVALMIATVANIVIPADLRTPAATVTSTPGEGPVGVASIAIFYIAANSYLLYAFAAAGLWTSRYARGAEPRLRRGLRIATFGLASISLAGATFVASNISRWAGTPAPPPVIITSVFLLLLGIVLFVVGLAYPTVKTWTAALRVWLRHRRAHRRLRPLWTVLNEQFPQDALSRVPTSPWRDALQLRSVHRRYYRRVIECRDGLVRISPYLANLGADPAELADPERLARQLSDALRAHAAGETVPTQAIPIALPAEDSLDADVDRLIELSRAVERASLVKV
ncbi:MAB_1171c family putative transporter [Actinophytocola sp.]|uniref:MAB_1171c family putative transporter n=1 Tax=Actinophytocola sp. TaxID=1872138 RepID=UPI003D6A93EB